MPARCHAQQLMLLKRFDDCRRPMHGNRAPATWDVYMHNRWPRPQKADLRQNKDVSPTWFTCSVLMVDLLEVG